MLLDKRCLLDAALLLRSGEREVSRLLRLLVAYIGDRDLLEDFDETSRTYSVDGDLRVFLCFLGLL